MKITFLGHASFLVQTKDTNLLIDPWYSDKGAFLRSWYQFPKNHHMIEFIIEEFKLKKNNYIFVTHNHEDHFDVRTLSVLSSYCKNLIIPDYKNKFFQSQANELNFDNLLIFGEEKSNKAGDLTLNIFIQETSINIDSGILVSNKNNQTFLNLNDCKLHDRFDYISEKYGKINVLTQQFSGASMHPVTYQYATEEYKKICSRKKKSKMRGVINAAKILLPDYFIPAAGPPVFLRDCLLKLNFESDTTFPKFWEFYEFFKKSVIKTQYLPLNLKGYIDLSQDKIEGKMEKMSYKKYKTFVDNYRKYFLDYTDEEKFFDANVKTNLFRELKEKLAIMKDFSTDNYSDHDIHVIYFTSDNVSFIEVNLKQKKISFVDEITEASYYCHVYEDEFLNFVLKGQCTWSAYFLSFMFKNKRTPDKYNTLIEAFLISNNPEEFMISLRHIEELRKNNEKIKVKNHENGVEYSCKRFCPHQGADLKYAIVKDGKVVCPRHGWKFDLKKGGQCISNNFTINSEII